MKRHLLLLALATAAFAAVAFAADSSPGLRPSQKLMQARKAGIAAMNQGLAARDFAAVAREADVLAAEAKTTGEKHPNPRGKELTLAISAFAAELSAAAARQDGETVKARLADIGKQCSACHAELRDKR